MSALVLEAVELARGRGRSAVRALRDATLRLDAGELVLLEGPSGSGKTSLLCAAAGLLTPLHGRVLLDGRDLATLPAARRRSLRAAQLGFVFQRANLIQGLTVRDNVRLAAALAGVHAAEADRRTTLLLRRLGIGELADRHPDRLSGGEEHRVALARALVHRPALVLADEPTGSLDGTTGRAVIELLAELAREADAAVLVATHDHRLRDVATRRVAIEDGRLSEAPR